MTPAMKPGYNKKPPDTSGALQRGLAWKLARAGSPNIGHKFQKSNVFNRHRNGLPGLFCRVSRSLTEESMLMIGWLASRPAQ